MAMMFLCKQGYGSLNEITSWDTEQFLDAIEYESMTSAIERHYNWKSENERKR